MTYSPILIVHICAGIIAVFAGSAALVVRKGGRLHRRTGDVFVISMLIMATSGASMALVKSQRGNVLAGVFTFYLVATAAVTVMRREKWTGRVELGLLIIALAAGTSGWILAWRDTDRGSVIFFSIFASIASLAAAGDIRMLIRGGVTGARRLVRHVWRMGLALFVASGSLFLGTASDPVMKRSGLRATLFTPAIRATHLPEIPVLIVVVITIFWLCRLLFTKAYKQPAHRSLQDKEAVAERQVRSIAA
ncbi:MAG TPA: DUF2306 domain-containing protein [Thermoanaerobaculia bacterium]|nr:DUF2306 domain-containing protein [Thermoanaerobaculia bacterium]